MDRELILEKTQNYVKETLKGDSSGHDWWHIYRVVQNALAICKYEQDADEFIVRLAALLHDIADYKFHGGDTTIGSQTAEKWLRSLSVSDEIIAHVSLILSEISFKGAGVRTRMTNKEGMIVQDADRLDAIGAIGIARAFAYGGFFGREIYNPTIQPQLHSTFEEYLNNKGTTINHFYEKLLLLNDLMNTDTAYQMALKRHAFMEEFLKEFMIEWEGKG